MTIVTQAQTRKTSSQRKRGRYAKTDRVRETIIDAAFKEFSQSGYHAVSMRSIAAAVGMTEAGISYHFPSKAKLLEAIIAEDHDKTMAEITHSGDARKTLRSTIAVITDAANDPEIIRLQALMAVEAVDPEHPAHDYYVSERLRGRDLSLAICTDLQRRNLLAEGLSPRLAGDMIASMFDGVQSQWLLDLASKKRNIADMAEQLEAFFNLLAPGWREDLEAEEDHATGAAEDSTSEEPSDVASMGITETSVDDNGIS